MLWKMFHACSKIPTNSCMWEDLMPSCLEKYLWISTVSKVVTTTSVRLQPSSDKLLKHLLFNNEHKNPEYICILFSKCIGEIKMFSLAFRNI